MSKMTQQIFALTEPIATGFGLRLWDVRYEKEGSEWFLRILLDAERAVSIQDCENVSRAIDPLIEQLDPIKTPYYLEVGSAGLGRRLYNQRHFELMQNREVVVHFIRAFNGSKELLCTLLQKNDDTIKVKTVNGEEIALEQKLISYVKLADDLNLF